MGNGELAVTIFTHIHGNKRIFVYNSSKMLPLFLIMNLQCLGHFRKDLSIFWHTFSFIVKDMIMGGMI